MSESETDPVYSAAAHFAPSDRDHTVCAELKEAADQIPIKVPKGVESDAVKQMDNVRYTLLFGLKHPGRVRKLKTCSRQLSQYLTHHTGNPVAAR